MEMHQQLIEFSWTLLMHLATVLVLFLIPKNNKVVSMSHWQRPFLNMVILLFPFQYIFCF